MILITSLYNPRRHKPCANQIAQGLGHQQIGTNIFLRAISEVEENVIPLFLKKLNVNTTLLKSNLRKGTGKLPKVSGGEIMLSGKPIKP